jgi:hypothetical protein
MPLRYYDGIPTAEEEALQPPSWDPVDTLVAGLTVPGSLPVRAVASGVDALSQGMMQTLPPYVALPASMALGHAASRAMPADWVPQVPARLRNEVGAVGTDITPYVDVWHASPHKFDRFDSSKIDTGEGSQYKGWGLYFAENPAVSGPGVLHEPPSAYDQVFQKRATNALNRDIRSNPTGRSAELMRDVKAQRDELRNSFMGESFFKTPSSGRFPYQWTDDYNAALRFLPDWQTIYAQRHGQGTLEAAALERQFPDLWDYWQANRPRIYNVRLNAPKESFLKLEDPFPENMIERLPSTLQDYLREEMARGAAARARALARGVRDPGDMGTPFTTEAVELMLRDASAYDVSRVGTSAEAFDRAGQNMVYGEPSFIYADGLPEHSKIRSAKYLAEQGIPGIRFWDAVSRRTGGGTENYVMYPGNDDKIEILKRYGLALSAGAGYGAMQQNNPPTNGN